MARLRSVQALFQMEASGAGVEQVVRDFDTDFLCREDGGPELAETDAVYFRTLLDGVLSHQSMIDTMADAALKEGWPFHRIDPTLRAVFRSAGAELVLGTAPPTVTIDEFVEVTKAFHPDGKAAGFVNGVLDSMARNLKRKAAAAE